MHVRCSIGLRRLGVPQLKAHLALGEDDAALLRAQEAVELNRGFGQRLELARSLLVPGTVRGGGDGARGLGEAHALFSAMDLPAV
ncbi:hypothetical protein [Allokutzneria oryzae]|uniref:Uncharacterized protein n=1 Tax=Allokutzneria oryzae TaxID=1378989 RepID=A0ABV6A2C4_9PSEU